MQIHSWQESTNRLDVLTQELEQLIFQGLPAIKATKKYLTNRLHYSVCVYCNRSQMTSQRVKKTKSSCVTIVLYTLWRLLWSITVATHTHTEKCNLFVLYIKNANVLSKNFGGHEKTKTSLLTWSDVIWRHLCVCPLIDHGQQPMKIHT